MSESTMHFHSRSFIQMTALIAISLIVISCGREVTQTGDPVHRVSAVLDSFHVAAARADYAAYFDCFAADAVFIGTDATERWDKRSLMVWAKPYFDRGRAWSFTAIERHIMIDEQGQIAWFDELLDTQMKLCRGSGVLQLQSGEWRIRHYVLSMTVPNSIADSVVTLKTPIEDGLLSEHTESQH